MPERGEGRQNFTEGTRLLNKMELMARIIQQETDHSLLQFDREKLERLKRIDAVVVVGPSGAGKSTLVDVARGWVESPEGKKSNLVVPKRIVSRPRRDNDNTIENDFASTAEEFEEKTAGGIRWQRKMDQKGEKIERYGFVALPEGSIPIYSANLALLSPDAQLEGAAPGFLDHALVVYIDAKPHIRDERLQARSPDIMTGKPKEAAMRLAGDTENIRAQAHVTLRTRSVPSEQLLSADTLHLMLRTISEMKRAV